MKLSLNWMKEYVDLPDVSTSKLAYDLTMCTVEVEEVEDLAESMAGLVVGKIEEVKAHPNADRLRICMVDTGRGEPSEIVCGGSNLRAGQLVITALPGAFVRWHGEGEPVEIKATKLRGVMSYGMICAAGEIGLEELFPPKAENEIVDITELGAEPGTPAAEALGIDDIILEIDNKSMTNRPDLWGHYGMARELAAIYKAELKPLSVAELPGEGGLKVAIEDADRCRRYCGIVIDGVKTLPSPFALKTMLWRVGIRPINLAVDITNYVMLATGQPTHAFDKNHIHGGIVVRTAREGEKLELLDGEELELTAEDLVIADEVNPVGLAGVMGGKRDSILPETEGVIFESANFAPLSVRRTAQRFDVRTEASARFEKGLDPQRVDQAVAMAVNMFKKYFPDCTVSGRSDVTAKEFECAEVDITLPFLEKRLGKPITANEAAETLARLGFKTEADGEVLHITAPSWRSTGDISLPDDILEEIARLMGYENFDFLPPKIELTAAINQRDYDTERAIREYLAFRCGMREIFTYPWTEDEYNEAAGADFKQMLKLSTPPAPDAAHLRSTLVPGLLKAVFINQRYMDKFRLFEMTHVFFDGSYASLDWEEELLPKQRLHLGGAFVGDDARALFLDAKGVLEHMGATVQCEPLGFRHEEKPLWADGKLWLNITAGDEVIGSLGLVSRKTAQAAGIKRVASVIFELDSEKLVPLASRQNEFEHLPVYPLVDFDLSVIFDETVTWAEVESTVMKASAAVKRVAFVDEYRGEQVGEGKKSVSFRIWIGSDKGTMAHRQIEQESNRIIRKITKKLDGNVRSA